MAMRLKVYRKDNRRKDVGRWRRSILRFSIAIAAGVCALALYRLSDPLLIAAASLRDFIVENRYFSVREIRVRGGEKVNGNVIVAVAGLRQGMNIWKIDLAEIESKVAKHPWVRRVVVRREFPRRITIDVEERVPRAIVALRKLYYVDSDGVIFKEVDASDDVKFPTLTGLSVEQLTAPDPILRKRIQEAMGLSELMARRSFSLSEIRFEGPDRLVVYTTNHPMALRMGWGDWDEKLERLERLLSLWQGNEARLASLDMSFRDRVVARLRRVER
jgi:cell division septal protein FtsQ